MLLGGSFLLGSGEGVCEVLGSLSEFLEFIHELLESLPGWRFIHEFLSSLPELFALLPELLELVPELLASLPG